MDRKDNLLIIILVIAFMPCTIYAQCNDLESSTGCLFGFNTGAGIDWPGWKWVEDTDGGGPGVLGYTETQGWERDPLISYPGSCLGPTSMEVPGYNGQIEASIDANVRAPSTDTGGALMVRNTGEGLDGKAAWWIWRGCINLNDSNQLTKADHNRMSFYLKTQNMEPIREDGGQPIAGFNFHWGTYTCWEGHCPKESPNGHYYHFLTINSGGWIHVLMDQHPQHRRGTDWMAGPDPTYIEYGKHYFEHLYRMYFEVTSSGQGSAPTSYWIDEIHFYEEKEAQNDESVASLWVGYWPSEDHWEIGWNDMSYQDESGIHMNIETNSTFEIRWSTSPITNSNFDNATLVFPMFYSGETYCGAGNDHLVRRPAPDARATWTRFRIPDDIEQNHDQLYFAVRDVSKKGAHAGTQWPWKYGDGHDAPTSNIKTIDYHFSPGSGGNGYTQPASPENLTITQ